MKLSDKEFRTIVNLSPLVSIDFLICHEGKYLLGLRAINPAKGKLFVPGGRILKNEKIYEAITRITNDELGVGFTPSEFNLFGIYEHFHPKNFLGEDTSTHYVVICLEVEVSNIDFKADCQHYSFEWLKPHEIIKDGRVHEFVKDYFLKNQAKSRSMF